ncbi:MAG: hypothetical protein ABGZ53_30940 [Fuerstiella sp.]
MKLLRIFLGMTVLLSGSNVQADESWTFLKRRVGSSILNRFRDFAASELELTCPVAHVRDLGQRIRSVSGRLTDSTGHPVSDVVVAFVQTGVDRRSIVGNGSYIENFDVTDRDGQFQVEGFAGNTDLVFFRGRQTFRDTERIWVAGVSDGKDLQEFRWPDTATLRWEVPESVATPQQIVSIRRRQPLVHRFVPVIPVKVGFNNFVQASLMPGEYLLTVTPSLADDEVAPRHAVEIAQVSVTEGADPIVTQRTGDGIILGLCTHVKSSTYVTISRQNDRAHERAVDDATANDMIVPVLEMQIPNLRGEFIFRKIPPGRYVIRQRSTTRPPQPLYSIRTWRAEVTRDVHNIFLTNSTDRDSLRGKIEQILNDRSDYSGIHHLIFALDDDPNLVVHELGEILNDQDAPAVWHQLVTKFLCRESPDCDALVNVLAAAIPTLRLNDRMDAFRRLAAITKNVEHVVDELEVLRQSGRNEIRVGTLRRFADVALKHPEQTECVVAILEESLQDSLLRGAAIHALAALKQPIALTLLRESIASSGDRSATIHSAFLIWQLGGGEDDFLAAAHAALQQRALSPKLYACRQLTEFSKTQQLPETTQAQLRVLASIPILPERRRTEYDRMFSLTVKAAREALGME